jgi:glyoxylase-like metal-dependent hydrolase (beta-lactamase superfamily II)
MAGNKVRVGNVEITSLSDGMLEFDLCNFFPAIPEQNWQPYDTHLTAERKVRFNLASFLVRSDGRNILVDTGLGPKPTDAPETPWGELMSDFKAHGIRPEDIDMVVMTHLHRDHVGWNLQSPSGKYEPTFPKARYWMSQKDWEVCHQPEVQRDRFPNAPACVWPLEELGLIEFMEGEYALTSELTTLPMPGHTPGHMSIMINSQGERALILGDAAHNPAQVQETDWVSRADMDPEQTRVTRRSIMERLEREGILVAAGHFPAPGFGKIASTEGGRYWQAL